MDLRLGARSLRSTAALTILAVCATAPAMRAGGAERAAPSPHSADTVQQVTVVAPKWPNPKDVTSASVSVFISGHGRPAVVTQQLARWYEPVCPAVAGLSKGFDDFVAARIRAIAASVGAPLGEAGRCEPNVHIVFSTHPQALIKAVAAKNSQILGFHYPHEEKVFSTFNHPIQGWYITATKGDAGDIVTDNPMPLRTNSPAEGVLDAGTVPSARIDTRLATGLNSLLQHALLIADTKQVAGLTIGAVSDYLSVMVLSPEWLSESCGELPSIADLMAKNCTAHQKPQAITAGDIAYLRALYRQDLSRQYFLEKDVIRDDMMRQFNAHH